MEEKTEKMPKEDTQINIDFTNDQINLLLNEINNNINNNEKTFLNKKRRKNLITVKIARKTKLYPL